MALGEQTLRGSTIELAGAMVTITHRCRVMAFGTAIVATIYPTAVRIVVDENTTTFTLPW